MIKFMIQKLLHKKWMFVSLLVGNILLIAISCSYPMYKNASLQRMLTNSFDDYLEENNTYPFTLTLQGSIEKTQSTNEYLYTRQLYDTVEEELGVPVVQKVASYNTFDNIALSTMGRDDKKKAQQIQIGCLTELDAHINIISGEMYSDEIKTDGVIDAIVNQKTFNALNLVIGEEYEFESLKDDNGKPIRLRITGVFINSEDQDYYWVKNINFYENTCFISEKIFMNNFSDLEKRNYSVRTTWYVLMDYTAITPKQVPGIIAKTNKLMDASSNITIPKYLGILENYQQRAKKISITLLILQVPVLMLLCTFIFMISGLMLELEQNEIALLKSRGSGKWQLIFIYFLQSTFIALISSLIALPIGIFLCSALGSTNAFLEFVQRTALKVRIEKDVLLYCLGAAVVSISVMVLPVFKHASVTIVGYKQKKNKKNKKLWQRLYLDIVLLGVSLYGLYSFSSQKDLLLVKVLNGNSLDPLLYFSSSLFIIGASLVALRIQPAVVWIIFKLGKKRWKAASYASFLQIIRTGYKQNFIMVFLIFTIALGIFNATIARTILSNADNNIEYRNGADIVVREVWSSNSDLVEMDKTIALQYKEPSFEKYKDLAGASSITRVILDKDVIVSDSRGAIFCTVMGINTKEFGETSWFKEGLLPEEYYQYLNTLSTNSDAILVSGNFRDLYGSQVGDVITYKKGSAVTMGIIYGFVDYWPTYVPRTTTLMLNGTTDTTENFLIVAHYSKIQDIFGITPYQVWIKAEDSTQFIYDFSKKYNVKYVEFVDVSEEQKEIRNDAIFQGTNGILTMSFIVVLILSCIGFLIYWILSIKSRELLFGVLRAMGMTKKEIISMLINEQIFSTGLSLVIGTVIGVLASRFFIPLIQIVYSNTDQIIPLELVTEQKDMLRLFAIILTVIIICMIILGRLISKIKISQALKLGED